MTDVNSAAFRTEQRHVSPCPKETGGNENKGTGRRLKTFVFSSVVSTCLNMHQNWCVQNKAGGPAAARPLSASLSQFKCLHLETLEEKFKKAHL